MQRAGNPVVITMNQHSVNVKQVKVSHSYIDQYDKTNTLFTMIYLNSLSNIGMIT